MPLSSIISAFFVFIIPWCRLQSDDSLVRVQEHKLSGTWPRSVAIRGGIIREHFMKFISKSFLLSIGLMVVVDQHGDSLEVIKVDNKSGLLSSTGNIMSTPPQPSFVGFMD